MIHKVLIANRGEIAVRIIRACRELGIQTVAIHSTADSDSLHVIMADESVCVGGPASGDSYLNIPNIVSAAVNCGADSIHPGFGFLSENAKFAQICADCNINFIGPSAEVILLLGDKAMAKETMIKAGVPTIPGSDGVVANLTEAKKIAKKIGYPLLIKAVAGGGGRGIRLVNDATELADNFDVARNEAKMFFGNDGVYIEKYLTDTRHIEFQVMADKAGRAVHLGERDCSMQRRNQKMVEESPSAKMSAELRKKMGAAAVKATKASGYYNVGTVEFLVTADNEFYFMEMNTRIQVEHPVTEQVTGIDIVKQQIMIADGKKLPFAQKDIELRGHAIECRINAEDPSHDFRPTGGFVEYLHVPSGMGVRFDSVLYQGYSIPMHYDSMLGKLIVWANTRDEAIAKMDSALSELIIEGVGNNIEFLRQLIGSKEFKTGEYDMKTIGKIKGE
ncbi:MAG: acetyl-CoA carboxylase biotin carboxylase subunit [Clostridiales bacterium]|jgi:acetyl-CoA carboxylase biotin carboxylase subunit|nr:acetyl-CoA carboxylase biotin carboxylase subunit [Clostridiales bacterium]